MSNQKTIGIVGGGQLGRMLTQAAKKLGYRVVVLDPTPNSPAGQVADEQIVGSFKSKDDIFKLAEVSDYVTFEIESANLEALEELHDGDISVHPTPGLLKTIKDKYEQKVFLKENNIAVSDFAKIESKEDAKKFGNEHGYPFLLKARFGAYDGRGNQVVKNENEIEEGIKKLGDKNLYAEKFVPFKKELAVVCARGVGGEVIAYPVVETIHQNNICHIVRSPAPVSEDIIKKVQDLAEKVLQSLKGVGVIAIEIFLTEDEEVLVNEIAPRVHNSGHHTIEAFDRSQFENHIRAIVGEKLEFPVAIAEKSVMINILGDRQGGASVSPEMSFDFPENVNVHIYGKIETRLERKMGHITTIGNNVEELEDLAKNIRKQVNI